MQVSMANLMGDQSAQPSQWVPQPTAGSAGAYSNLASLMGYQAPSPAAYTNVDPGESLSLNPDDEDDASNDGGTQSIISGLGGSGDGDDSAPSWTNGLTLGNLTPAEDSEEDQAYWASQPAAVQALQNVGNPTQRAEDAEQLASEGYSIDDAIDVNGWDPETTMLERQQDGYTWVPSANQPNIQEAPGLSQPGVPSYDPNSPPPGSIAVQTNFINQPPSSATSPSPAGTPALNPPAGSAGSAGSAGNTTTAPTNPPTASNIENPSASTPVSALTPAQDAAEDNAYWAAQPAAVQALRNISNPTQRAAQAAQLASEGYQIDNAIDVDGWDPETTMMERQQDGYTWVPAANQPNIQEAPGLSQPGVPSYNPNDPPAGSIQVNTDWLS